MVNKIILPSHDENNFSDPSSPIVPQRKSKQQLSPILKTALQASKDDQDQENSINGWLSPLSDNQIVPNQTAWALFLK